MATNCDCMNELTKAALPIATPPHIAILLLQLFWKIVALPHINLKPITTIKKYIKITIICKILKLSYENLIIFSI